MFLVLISIGMGKSLDNPKVQFTLIGISIILCGFNFFVVIYAIAKLFDSVLSFLILIAFLLTYIVPPILYDTKIFFLKLHNQILGIFSYILCMPLYLIVFQIYSYANLHDVSWGNRDPSADMNMQ